MSKKVYDAVIVGGGHNGITLGAYLQRAGLKTAIFERRHEEGSAIFTSECTAPGFLHNLHCQYIEFNDHMPFLYDFELEKFGARFMYPHAQAGVAFSDGRPPIVLYSIEHPENFEKTHKSIAQYSKHDADLLVDIKKKSMAFWEAGAKRRYSLPVFPDSDGPDPREAMRQSMAEIFGVPAHIFLGSAKDVYDYMFECPELKILLYRMAVEWALPLDMMGTGAGALASFGIYFLWRLSVGGTHSFAHAMVMAAVNEGMDFFESSEVVKILIDKGKATGVRLKDGTEIVAEKVVASNADFKATFLDMVGEENLSPLWVDRVKNFKIGPTCVLASTALALHEAPDFKSAKHNPDINKTFYTVVGFDTPEEMAEYCAEAEMGRIPRTAGAGIWVNSLWDPTYAPPGKHSLTGWFFFPKASSQTREKWEEVKATHNDKFVRRFEQFAPNMTWDNIIDDYFYTPQDIEDEMRLMEGDFTNRAIRPDQGGANCPIPEAADYRTEIENLYICGPYIGGPGISSAGGYCAYKAIIEDLGMEKTWEKTERGY